ncbi:hypothetical protein EJ06DRAFT_519803 [Trichodelitschia bisporula]|uniref:BZIP domain-containing protein n=1 Tax=Trichodelitschia bisporula TaxID=703511 RepID=A0A6G1I3E1_9PEZI|nr:hypothetical protein EJ06DRAFT_519803 [Trichodelitschia bisporula]
MSSHGSGSTAGAGTVTRPPTSRDQEHDQQHQQQQQQLHTSPHAQSLQAESPSFATSPPPPRNAAPSPGPHPFSPEFRSRMSGQRAPSPLQQHQRAFASLSPRRSSDGGFTDTRGPASSSRALDVLSILNPPSQAELELENHARRRSAAQVEGHQGQRPAIHRPAGTPPAIATDIQYIPGTAQAGAGELSPLGGNGRGRRILTPVSPRIIRGSSFSRFGLAAGTATGTINASENLFLSPITRADGAPGFGSLTQVVSSATTQGSNLPPNSAPHRSSFALPSAPTPTPPGPGLGPIHSRRASLSAAASSAPSISSARASPSPSYSSYGQASGQASPSLPHPGMASLGASVSGQSSHGSYRGPGSHVELESESGSHQGNYAGHMQMRQNQHQQGGSPYGIPLVPSGMNNIQLITINTTRGTTQLPVDVHAASKQADEKRKRNAGASARFRARRKEKEIIAATTIARLENELAMARDEAEFYQLQSNTFAAKLQSMGQGQYVEQQPKMAKRRYDMPDANEIKASLDDMSEEGGSGGEQMHGGYSRDTSMGFEAERPATRRRTESYVEPAGVASVAATHGNYTHTAHPYAPPPAPPQVYGGYGPNGPQQQQQQPPQGQLQHHQSPGQRHPLPPPHQVGPAGPPGFPTYPHQQGHPAHQQQQQQQQQHLKQEPGYELPHRWQPSR